MMTSPGKGELAWKPLLLMFPGRLMVYLYHKCPRPPLFRVANLQHNTCPQRLPEENKDPDGETSLALTST